jgi:hypothetical protein
MNSMPEVMCRKLLYLLHRGFLESRQLAQRNRQQQLYDLADALEPLPGFLAEWREEYLGLIRSNLEAYQHKYPGAAWDYLVLLDMEDDAFLQVFSRW